MVQQLLNGRGMVRTSFIAVPALLVYLCLSQHQRDHRGLYTIRVLQPVSLTPTGCWWSWKGGLVESEGQAVWDEDDVMLFFWGNSQDPKEPHLKKV